MLNEPVVVGYDKTTHSDHALAEAAGEAVLRGSALHILHAYDSPGPSASGQNAAQRETAKQIVREAAAAITARHPGLPVDMGVEPGDPAEVLAAASRGAALLVVGHHDAGSAPVPDSVALRVLAGVCCPLLVARGGLRRVRNRVLVPVDIDESCDDLLRFAFASASRRGAGLTAVNVWDEPWVLESAETGDASGEIDALAADRVDRLDRLIGPWRSEYPGVRAVRQVRIGIPGPVLAPMSAASDLLVVGAHRHGGEKEGMRAGPVANAALHWSRCPVALVPVD